MTVTARRLTADPATAAQPVTRFSQADLQAHPALRLDDILRLDPAFSLFRRQGSLAANPTTQGVTLRGLGPNGAGRTLVLLDGVPINDPFGGWVYFSRLDPERLGAVRLIKGASAGRFGNQALTGTLDLRTAAAPDRFAARGHYGRFDTVDLSAQARLPVGDRVAAVIGGRYFRSDGFRLLAADQAGPVDVPAATNAATARLDLGLALGPETSLTVSADYFQENRENGVAGAANRTEAVASSARLVHDAGADALGAEAVLYFRTRDFSQSFAAVFDAARTVNRVVLDQFDVPGEALGALGTVRLPLGRVSVELGGDVRYLTGETNERFRNLGDGFTRRRRAGGEQIFAGGFVRVTAEPLDALVIDASLRGDYWRVFDGRREEFDLADGSQLLDLAIDDRSDGLVNGRLDARYRLGAFSVRAAGYSGFRVPTLNEFFRPFRVGNDITEANAALAAERLYGAEAGLAYEPLNAVRLSLGYVRTWLEDGVGNVTIAQGPGVFTPGGFVPADGSLRQRQNIDRIVADGLEAIMDVAIGPVQAELRYQFVAARIADFPDDPSLEGNRVAQSPRHGLGAAIRWAVSERLRLGSYLTYASAAFEDDLNSRRLDGFVTLDLTAHYRVTDWLALFLNGRNLGNVRVESAISADGLITLGPPRTVTGGARIAF